MKDECKTKGQLIHELSEMRRRVGELRGLADGPDDKQELSASDILYRTILETAPS
jgi:hypothetical protein